jgi:ribosome-associated protein
MARLTARELALQLAHVCSEKGGEELRVMALPPGATLFDYVVLVSARSDRQTSSIVEAVHRFCKNHKIPHRPIEGESGWMLVDCLDVVVHALSEEMRARYQLDTLWKSARDLAVDTELAKLARLPGESSSPA